MTDQNGPLETLLKFVPRNSTEHKDAENEDILGGISAVEYFDPDVDLTHQDIGRPKHVNQRSISFTATLWLSDKFPLSLQEQVTPIVDLMAASNAHFARLKRFIELQLPAGFPVKIEMPLFHVLSARITFLNVSTEGLDQQLFAIPEQYTQIDNANKGRPLCDDVTEQDDMYLKFAIRQSLADISREQSDFNRAIAESLRIEENVGEAAEIQVDIPSEMTEEEQVQKAIELSLNELRW